MKKSILNSFALLAWIQDEPGAQIVEDVLYKAQDESEGALLNIINLWKSTIEVRMYKIPLLPVIL